MAKQNGTAAKPPEPAAERLPAYFLSLTLENVRCFGPKQTLNLSTKDGKPAPWTIILGLNGTGKTTLLQSLAFDFGFFGTHTRSRLFPLDHFFQFVSSLCRCYQQTESLVTHTTTAEGWVPHPIHSDGTEIETIYAESPLKLSVRGPLAECIAYGAGRRVGNAALSEAEADDPTATLFSDRAELRNPEEWLLQLDYAAAKSDSKDAKERFDGAKALLLSIMPDGEVSDLRAVAGTGSHPKPRVEFETPYGWVPLRQLGYGYQTLITWVADLANRMAERYPNSKNPLHEPAVVLVDEIDLHLHPKWQRKLMAFLRDRFPNVQFIATAHSPLIAQAAAQDANLAVLRREGDHVVIDNDLGHIRNWRIDQILTSDLFGLETARPPQIEGALAERAKLLSKSKLSAAEKKRLEQLEAEIGELPMGETADEVREREEIKETLKLLMSERKKAAP